MILSALCPLLCNSTQRLSTLYRCSLTTMAQDKPYHEKSLIRDCFNHKGSCTLFRPYLTIAAGISSSSFVRLSTRQLAVSSLSKGISSALNFHESIGTDGKNLAKISTYTAIQLAHYCSFYSQKLAKVFASKNLVTVQTQLRLYSEEQRAFGISNICYCCLEWPSVLCFNISFTLV